MINKNSISRRKHERQMLSVFIGTLCLSALVMIITISYQNKAHQERYIPQAVYLEAENELSLMKDKVETLEMQLEEQRADYEARLKIYENEVDYLTSKLKENIDIEQQTYESINPTATPSSYRAIPIVSFEAKRTPVTNLTVTEMNELVNYICEERACSDEDPLDNPFYNSGESFYNMECETGISAIYIMGIFTVESSFGKNMCKPNNAGGLTNGSGSFKSFNTINDCILYTGQLLSRYRDNYDLETIEEIGSRYCPVNPAWPTKVTEFVNEYSSYV